MKNLFRSRVEADVALQNQLLSFLDEGAGDRESSLAVLVQWRDPTLRSALESVFDSFVREYRDSGTIVSPGSFLERLVQSLDASFGALEPEMQRQFEIAIALTCGRGLYLLYSNGLEAQQVCAGEATPLESSIQVRVKDLSPSNMRRGHLWSETLVERLHLVRVFIEDETHATLQLVTRPDVVAFDDPFATAKRPLPPKIVVDKQADLDVETLLPLAGVGSNWPNLDEAPRKDRSTLSYAALALLVLFFGTALLGMWRWQRIGSQAASPSGAERLFAESVDSGLEPRGEESRVSPEVVESGDRVEVARAVPEEETPLSIVWSKQHSDWVTSSPKLADGRVVYGCRDGHLYAVDKDGAVKWEFDSGSGIGATPAVHGGRVYCGNYAGQAFALEAGNGKLRWSVELGARLVASPVTDKKRVFFASQNGELVALNQKSGKVAWQHSIGGKLRVTPLVTGKEILIPDSEGQLLCLESGSGALRWTYQAGSQVTSSPVRHQDLVLFGSKDGNVHAIGLKDGGQRWMQKTRGTVAATPALGRDFLFVGSGDKKVYALRPESGEIAWTFSTQANLLATPSVHEDRVYVAAYDRHTYILEASTGRQLAKLRLKAPIYSSPLVVDDRIYVGSNDGTLYCMSTALD